MSAADRLESLWRSRVIQGYEIGQMPSGLVRIAVTYLDSDGALTGSSGEGMDMGEALVEALRNVPGAVQHVEAVHG